MLLDFFFYCSVYFFVCSVLFCLLFCLSTFFFLKKQKITSWSLNPPAQSRLSSRIVFTQQHGGSPDCNHQSDCECSEYFLHFETHSHTVLYIKMMHMQRGGARKGWRWGRERGRGDEGEERWKVQECRLYLLSSSPHSIFTQKTLSSAAANQSDKAFILLLINSIHLANQAEVLHLELLTVSHVVSLEDCLLVQICEVWGLNLLSLLLAVFFICENCRVMLCLSAH